MNRDLLLVSKEDGVGIVRLNREEKLNAINRLMYDQLRDAFNELSGDENVRAIILAGTAKVFSSGSDLNDLKEMKPLDARRYSKKYSYQDIVYDCEKPTIAMITGYCLGGGLELALSCDIRLASNDSTFGCPEIKHGLFPTGGLTQLMPRLVGYGRAMQFILTGEMIDAVEAKEIGLVNEVYQKDEIEKKALELGKNLAKNDLELLKLAKELVRASFEIGVHTGKLLEREVETVGWSTPAHREGVKAFFEKRTPRF